MSGIELKKEGRENKERIYFFISIILAIIGLLCVISLFYIIITFEDIKAIRLYISILFFVGTLSIAGALVMNFIRYADIFKEELEEEWQTKEKE